MERERNYKSCGNIMVDEGVEASTCTYVLMQVHEYGQRRAKKMM